jgi:disulfide bond formation protein DsbB
MSLQKISIIGFLICAAVLCAAYYLEYQYMLAACPLCILQRIVFMALGLVFLIGIIIKFKDFMVYLYGGSIILLSLCGAALAGRQIWLQYFAPPQKISCSASLSHLLEIYPFLSALKIALAGSGECAIIDFKIFGLSIAAWSLVIFSAIALTMLYTICWQKKRRI